jgi:hypothetical protein
MTACTIHSLALARQRADVRRRPTHAPLNAPADMTRGPLDRAAVCRGCKAILLPMTEATQLTLGGRVTSWCGGCWRVQS